MSTDTPSTSSTHAPAHGDPSPDEVDGLSAPVHRDSDGNALAISLVLSPDQIRALNVPGDVDAVSPVVRNGMLHLEPADS